MTWRRFSALLDSSDVPRLTHGAAVLKRTLLD